MNRYGMVIKIKAENVEEYKRLHADPNPGVRDLLNKYHIHNFSIFLIKIKDEYYEFGYYEYAGDDHEGDMAGLAAEPRNKEWLTMCDPMQIPLDGYPSWAHMQEIYHND